MSAFDYVRKSLEGLLDKHDLARGYAYALQGRATIARVRRNGRAVHIEASCRGSRPRPYSQTVTLEFDEDGALEDLHGECSCPVGLGCKHVACAALVWLSANTAPPTPRVPNTRKGHLTAEPRPVHLSDEAQRWLGQLERSLKRAESGLPKGDRVFYKLRGDAGAIAVDKGRVLKDGRSTGVRSLAPDFGWVRDGREPPRYLSSQDVPVFEALASLRRSDDYLGWELDGAQGAKALESALATGRLWLVGEDEWSGYGQKTFAPRDGGEGTLKSGPPVTASLALQTDRSGATRWALSSPHHPQHAQLTAIAVSPPWYLDRGRGELGRLDIAMPEPVARQLLRMPPIEPRSAPLFLSTLGSVVRAAGLAEIAAQIPAPADSPVGRLRARLKVCRGLFREYGNGRRGREHRRWIAELWFDYSQDLALPSEDPIPPGVAWRDAKGVERVALRDAEAERAVRQTLAGAGMVFRHSAGHGGLVRVDAQRGFLCPGDGSDQAWKDRAERLFEAAVAVGAEVECDPEFPYRLREAQEFYEELRPDAAAPGWFDLELGVVVDGKRVPVADAIADWVRRMPDMRTWLEAADAPATVLLRVAALGVIRFPALRLKQLLAPLLESFGFERPGANGALRLSRIEAALLPATLPAAKGAGVELTQLRERLADFRGVSPATPSPGFRGALRPYQQSGLDWLQFLREFGLAGILADDMGLGKTVQALAHLDLEKASGRAGRPSLVVAPTSVLPNWRDEAARFAPHLTVLTLHGPERAEEHARIAEADLVLTSYPLLARDRDALIEHEWHLIIFDEAQFLKNAKTQTHAAAAALRARHRLALTGTPIENNLGELWAHFNLLLPGFLGDARQFARTWRTPIERGGDSARMARLARRVRPFVLRRIRAEVLADLPEKTEIVRHVELEGAQRDLYESLRIALDSKLRRAIAAKGIAGSQIMILDALLKLRQACCDPRLVKADAAKAAHGASAKLEALREMLEELRAEGKRALLFSQFTSMLDLIEPELPALGVRHVRLTGETRDRETPVKTFQAGEADLFLISLRAGGTGLNLTAADTVIHYDPWWNPAVEAQATARAHRIGQAKEVFVFKLIARGTVEERILQLLARKQALADALLAGGQARGALITEDDLSELLRPIASDF